MCVSSAALWSKAGLSSTRRGWMVSVQGCPSDLLNGLCEQGPENTKVSDQSKLLGGFKPNSK